MEILRIATAGSVDDGKSTLIGRLLFETQSITKDKIEALKAASQRKGLDFVDLSLLTDGLIAEREQGITIDVAHIYFNTPTRKYIIADTPGHFEYTRNMVTGASNASVSIILIDARHGVSDQTKRHFFIASMLKMKNVIVAVNKMDLVNYDEAVFNTIKADFYSLVEKLNLGDIDFTFIPLSSLYGENIVKKSEQMPWYPGVSLLDLLEQIPSTSHLAEAKPFRFQVQSVIRPKTEEYHDFRGFAGKISSGTIKPGDKIMALPSQQTSTVDQVLKFNEPLTQAGPDESIVITLSTEIDISRGGMIVHENASPDLQKEISAQVCWMDATPLIPGKTYKIQHGVNQVRAKVSGIESVLEIENMTENTDIQELKLNNIGKISLRLSAPIFADVYNDNPKNGSFIFIDEQSNGTVGVGFVL
jgi:sulfate adenylyltransferase subunit 1